jgi:hypothetical protein
MRKQGSVMDKKKEGFLIKRGLKEIVARVKKKGKGRPLPQKAKIEAATFP